MSVDWEFIQATMVVISFEFLALGVLVLTLRAYRANRRGIVEEGALMAQRVPEPPLLAISYVQFSKPIPVAPTAKFLAVGTEVDDKFDPDDSFGACWNVEADWADLVEEATPPLPRRRVPRASVPSTQRETNCAIPLRRALECRPASDDQHPIFGKKTRIYSMNGHPLGGEN